MGLGSGIRDPGSGKNLFRIPDSGSRGQKGTRSGIPDPDPQHCLQEKSTQQQGGGGREKSIGNNNIGGTWGVA